MSRSAARFRPSKSIAMALAAATLVHGQAKADATFGDWDVIDSACAARTATYLDSSTFYSLIVTADKTGARPIEVTIRPENSKTSSVKGFRYALDSSKIYSFGKMPKNEAGRDTFWNIPINTMALIAHLKASNQVNVDGINGGELPFSMNGSTAALNRLQQKCGSAAFTFTTAFEKEFAMNEINKVDLNKLTTDKTNALRGIVLKAVGAFKAIEKIRAELAALEARYKRYTDEQSQVAGILKGLYEDLRDQTLARDNAQKAIDTAEANIVELKKRIASSKTELAAAELDAKNAYDALKPFIPEHDRLLNLMENDQDRLSRARQFLASVEQSIAENESRISSLNNELQGLSDEASRNGDELRRADLVLRRAEGDVRDFRFDREVQRRRQADRRLDHLDREISNLQGQVANQQRAVQQATADRDARAANLRRCETGTASNVVPGSMWARLFVSSIHAQADNRGNRGGNRGGDRPERPNRPGPQPAPAPAPTPAPTPAPAPAPAPTPRDCSAARSELNAAEARLNQQTATLNNLNAQITGKSSDRQRILNDIDGDVRRMENDLNQRLRQARQDVAELERQSRRINDRIQSIQILELPRAQSDLTSLRSQLPGAQSELRNSEAALARSTSAYQSYKRRVNYDTLKQRVDQTAARVSSIKSRIAGFESEVRSNERRIVEQTNARDVQIAKIATTNKNIAAREKRAAELVELLKPYNVEKDEVMGRLKAAQQVLKTIQGEFVATMPLK